MGYKGAPRIVMVGVWMGVGVVKSRRNGGDLRAGRRHNCVEGRGLRADRTQGRQATAGRRRVEQILLPQRHLNRLSFQVRLLSQGIGL